MHAKPGISEDYHASVGFPSGRRVIAILRGGRHLDLPFPIRGARWFWRESWYRLIGSFADLEQGEKPVGCYELTQATCFTQAQGWRLLRQEHSACLSIPSGADGSETVWKNDDGFDRRQRHAHLLAPLRGLCGMRSVSRVWEAGRIRQHRQSRILPLSSAISDASSEQSCFPCLACGVIISPQH